MLKTEGKHLDELLDNVSKKIDDLIPNSRKYLKGGGDSTKTFAENAGFKLQKFVSKTKVFGQSEDYTCVATSLKMVLKDKNIVKSEEYLAQALNTNKDGARIKDIPDALYNSYLDDVAAIYEEKIKFSKLLEKLDVGDKAIVSVGTNEFKGHAMVLEKVENGKVFY